jgi:prophage DNA circulation protein
MKKTELTEAATTLKAILVVLRQSAKANLGTPGANLTYAVSVLENDVSAEIAGGTLGADLMECFTLAVAAGATLPSMLAVFTAAGSAEPAGKPALAVAAACQGYAAAAMGRILSASTFTSRDDVDAALNQIGSAFNVVESAAANALQTTLYQSLLTLHAAVTADLTTRSYPLPRLVTYDMGKTFSALSLAQRLYGDASRAGELAAENQTFHPAFMQTTGRALSA